MGDKVWMWFRECPLPFPPLSPCPSPGVRATRRLTDAVPGCQLVPVGKSPDDGLSYAVNPRFDSDGRWLPRREWPAELQ